MTPTGDPIQIREEIEATREELGDTVQALAAKTDVSSQAKRKFEETRAQVAATAGPKQALLVIAALGLAIFLLRHRSGRRD